MSSFIVKFHQLLEEVVKRLCLYISSLANSFGSLRSSLWKTVFFCIYNKRLINSPVFYLENWYYYKLP